MKNTTQSRDPIALFKVPPHPPPAVQKALERFDDLGTRWAQTKGERDDLLELIPRREGELVRAAGEALAAGKKVPDAEREIATLRAQLAAKERELAQLAVAVDIAGNEMADVLGVNAEEWAHELRAQADEAAGRYRAALDEAGAAIDDYGRASGAARWLGEFDAGRAKAGLERPFLGKGRVDVQIAKVSRNQPTLPVTQLLEIAASATEAATPTADYPVRS